MLQSSITDDERPILSPRTNGFVRSVLAAYAGHYHLRIRPDDLPSAKITSKVAKSGDDRKAEDRRTTGSVLSMRRAHKKSIEYTLDGVPYFTIPIGDIPAGYCEVNVTVNDNGEVFDCMMVAGHVASVWPSSPNAGLGTFDTISPAPQWLVFVKV
ncbi:uncharacterized protein TRAVEDRAFT_51239 [Trametes versicolor FP-101664 SS1]|uniref:uncharacterized protein n=1 Tax=Trametes versicolor (strain FP-101664) TaxID=717944 RepID=UPI00046231E4|nr:uncharacterized protein TRAVEDRAFT_51239 [Trametes versicolor FP-101664 SS1]EIW55113.1 hypothetical protein TRAVEDRAFT_51239 [Trametes versicolor FP-101664 SS1]